MHVVLPLKGEAVQEPSEENAVGGLKSHFCTHGCILKCLSGGKRLDGNVHCISAWMEQKHVREAPLYIFMNSCGKVSYNRHKLRKWIKFRNLWCLCETRTAVWTPLITQNWYILISRQLAATTIHLWDTQASFYLLPLWGLTNTLPLLTP